MMNWYQNTASLQIDITSHCNARCGACIRNKDGDEVRPELVLEHFDVDIWNRIAKEDTRGWYIRELVLNGNWGDPMMHPNLVEMLDTFASYHPEASLYIHTNGSMRTTKFWNDLATSCRKFANHVVVFAVDGLEDTHSIYRRKTVFSKIIENTKAFTANDGRANVTMTLFEHNKHQVKEVEALAEECGAIMFNLRESHAKAMYIDIKSGSDESYHIYASDDIQPYTKVFDDNDKSSLSDLRDYPVMIKARDIDLSDDMPFRQETKCPWYNDRMIQIDPWAVVWPCCHISLYGVDTQDHKVGGWVDDSINGARESNSLKSGKTLQEVLTDDWFHIHLETSIEKASWIQCRKTCGICPD